MAWLRLHRQARRLGTCPACRSGAIGAVEREPLEDDAGVELRLRCGECAAWRVARVAPDTARAVERRLTRDLERMGMYLDQAARWRDAELERLTRSSSSYAPR